MGLFTKLKETKKTPSKPKKKAKGNSLFGKKEKDYIAILRFQPVVEASLFDELSKDLTSEDQPYVAQDNQNNLIYLLALTNDLIKTSDLKDHLGDIKTAADLSNKGTGDTPGSIYNATFVNDIKPISRKREDEKVVFLPTINTLNTLDEIVTPQQKFALVSLPSDISTDNLDDYYDNLRVNAFVFDENDAPITLTLTDFKSFVKENSNPEPDDLYGDNQSDLSEDHDSTSTSELSNEPEDLPEDIPGLDTDDDDLPELDDEPMDLSDDTNTDNDLPDLDDTDNDLPNLDDTDNDLPDLDDTDNDLPDLDDTGDDLPDLDDTGDDLPDLDDTGDDLPDLDDTDKPGLPSQSKNKDDSKTNLSDDDLSDFDDFTSDKSTSNSNKSESTTPKLDETNDLDDIDDSLLLDNTPVDNTPVDNTSTNMDELNELEDDSVNNSPVMSLTNSDKNKEFENSDNELSAIENDTSGPIATGGTIVPEENTTNIISTLDQPVNKDAIIIDIDHPQNTQTPKYLSPKTQSIIEEFRKRYLKRIEEILAGIKPVAFSLNPNIEFDQELIARKQSYNDSLRNEAERARSELKSKLLNQIDDLLRDVADPARFSSVYPKVDNELRRKFINEKLIKQEIHYSIEEINKRYEKERQDMIDEAVREANAKFEKERVPEQHNEIDKAETNVRNTHQKQYETAVNDVLKQQREVQLPLIDDEISKLLLNASNDVTLANDNIYKNARIYTDELLRFKDRQQALNKVQTVAPLTDLSANQLSQQLQAERLKNQAQVQSQNERINDLLKQLAQSQQQTEAERNHSKNLQTHLSQVQSDSIKYRQEAMSAKTQAAQANESAQRLLSQINSIQSQNTVNKSNTKSTESNFKTNIENNPSYSPDEYTI